MRRGGVKMKTPSACRGGYARSEADAINLNRILPILILFYLYINILYPFFINCEVWKFSKIQPMYDKYMTKMITFAADKTS